MELIAQRKITNEIYTCTVAFYRDENNWTTARARFLWSNVNSSTSLSVFRADTRWHTNDRRARHRALLLVCCRFLAITLTRTHTYTRCIREKHRTEPKCSSRSSRDSRNKWTKFFQNTLLTRLLFHCSIFCFVITINLYLVVSLTLESVKFWNVSGELCCFSAAADIFSPLLAEFDGTHRTQLCIREFPEEQVRRMRDGRCANAQAILTRRWSVTYWNACRVAELAVPMYVYARELHERSERETSSQRSG